MHVTVRYESQDKAPETQIIINSCPRSHASEKLKNCVGDPSRYYKCEIFLNFLHDLKLYCILLLHMNCAGPIATIYIVPIFLLDNDGRCKFDVTILCQSFPVYIFINVVNLNSLCQLMSSNFYQS